MGSATGFGYRAYRPTPVTDHLSGGFDMKKPLSLAVQMALLASTAMALPALAGNTRASAQDNAQSQASSSTSSTRKDSQDITRLKTITVTASRRVELMKEVPISVSALSAQRIEKSNVRSATDLQYLVPNLTFSSTNWVSNGGGYQIRGIGTQTYDSGVEQSVGLVVDGVVIGLPRDPGVTGFGDIAQVEVLRGPQGTLFGKNSTAGVIQITTNDPVLGRTEAKATVMYGERNEHVARGMLNLPLGRSAAVRLAGYYQEQDGAIPYVNHPGKHVGDNRSSGLRAKAQWWITDNLTAQLTLEAQKQFARHDYTIESLGTPASATDWATLLYGAQFGASGPDPDKAYSDGERYVNVKTRGASLKLDYNMGDYLLTSISAWRKLRQDQPAGDIDASPSNLFNNSIAKLDSHEITQELRLTSPTGERLEYVLGLFYYQTDADGMAAQYGDYYNWLYCGLGQPTCGHMPMVSIGNGYRHQNDKVRSEAAYGEGSWKFNDHWKMRLGFRYTHDNTRESLHNVAFPFPDIPFTSIPPYAGEVSDSDVSGRASLQWMPNENWMVYATYARGYKGPAIDGSTGVVQKVDPEKVDSYEIGFKSTLLDGRMAFNLTAYQEAFHDFQTEALDMASTTPRFQLTNAGLMRTRGIEFDSRWRPVGNLTLSLHGAWNDATYRDYIGTCYTYQPVSATPGPGKCYVVDAATGTTAANYAGQRLANAPRLSWGFNGSYRHSIGHQLAFDASLDWAWRGDTYAITGDEHSRIPAHGLLNVNLGIGQNEGKWRVGLYARNLLDKRFYTVFPGGVLNPGGYFRITPVDAFRTVGVSLSITL